MTRKATNKKAAKPQVTTVYTVVQPIRGESPTHTEPERVFATKAAALAFAAERNHQLRTLTNPFAHNDPDGTVPGGEKAFIALVKKLGLKPPAKPKGFNYIDWEEWWDRSYFDTTDAQRSAIWDALEKFDWYRVKATTIE